MYHSELVGIIRKMVADNTDDIAYLPNLALIACREIERLATELDKERSRNNLGYYKATQAPWK
jgi:hypothetical protein